MLEFITELTESRLYKNKETLKGKSAEDIAKVTFLTILMLEIMRFNNSNFSKQYANSTLPYQKFDYMRNSASDLHNLLVVLANQDDFSDKIAVNTKISLPELQVKRYIRDVANGRKELALDRAFFKTLEDYLQIRDSNLRAIRRHVADWELNTEAERKSTINIIKQMANNLSQQNDLYQYFKSSL